MRAMISGITPGKDRRLMAGLAPRLSRASRVLLIALLLPAAVFLITGCAGANKEIQAEKDPKVLHDRAMDAYFNRNYDEAGAAFKKLMEDHPLSAYALEAELMIGDISYTVEKYDEAASYYTNFSALHPSHPRAAYALFQKGMSHFKEILTIDRDQSSTRKALFAFEDLVAGYPDSAYTGKAKELIGFLRKRLAESEFYVAHFYFKSRNYKGALARLRDILKNFPDSGMTDRTLYYIGESYIRLGEERLAEEAFTTLITGFPESSYVKEVKIRLRVKEG
ncbi:MAG: outer membrane protein assembly factor BamD [Deltaproteobacteria bacterium]|nr:outer membrane protein assembly factor BamD [Deltaproteobacteria bacterium]